MKCIYCNSDTNYKTRQSNGRRCGACRHPFAFEPKTDTLSIADGLFQRLIKDVSGDGALFFTRRQLWYELNRRLWRKQFWTHPWGAVTFFSGLGGIISAVLLTSFWPLGIGVAGVGAGIVMNRRNRQSGPRHPRVDYSTFESKYLGLWLATHGEIPKLIPSPLPRAKPEARETEPDLTAYSFDRAVITDREETAAVLIANNFHFENNCAILSQSGYPHDISDTVLTMLRRNPQLKVFALHDATVDGCALPRTVRQERWFPDPAVQVIDLGLRPRHVQALHLFSLTGPKPALSPETRALLTPEEAAWLESGETAELAALRPARLMRAVYQGFARATQGGDAAVDGDTGFIFIPDVYTPVGAADVYAADSFG